MTAGLATEFGVVCYAALLGQGLREMGQTVKKSERD